MKDEIEYILSNCIKFPYEVKNSSLQIRTIFAKAALYPEQ